MKIVFILIFIALITWLTWSYFASNVEQLKYTVLERKKNYEIRKYNDYIAAEVTVNSVGMDGLIAGFSILADYIFGGNLEKQSVAMTAPVLTNERKGESVAMTAPVLAKEENGSTTVTFSMPSKYTLETLPQANDTRIVFKKVSGKKMAAYRFTWYYTEERINQKKKFFKELLERDNVQIVGEPIFAGYTAPFTIPFMIRNEIVIEVE